MSTSSRTDITERMATLEAKHHAFDRYVREDLENINVKMDLLLESHAEQRGAAKFARVLYGIATIAGGAIAGFFAHLAGK